MGQRNPCFHCGEHMDHPRRKQCGSPECARAYNNHRQKEFYRNWRAEHGEHYQGRYNRDCYTRTCRSCGKEWSTRNRQAKRCGHCRYGYARDRRLPTPHPNPAPVTELPARHPARAPRKAPVQTLWVNGTCARCGNSFTVQHQTESRYCSPRCQRASAKDRRRALKRGSQHETYRRVSILDRDGWRCQICHRKTRTDVGWWHPMAPTIDHIVALAQGGTDTPDNVQCAHRACNSIKGAKGPGQLRLA